MRKFSAPSTTVAGGGGGFGTKMLPIVDFRSIVAVAWIGTGARRCLAANSARRAGTNATTRAAAATAMRAARLRIIV